MSTRAPPKSREIIGDTGGNQLADGAHVVEHSNLQKVSITTTKVKKSNIGNLMAKQATMSSQSDDLSDMIQFDPGNGGHGDHGEHGDYRDHEDGGGNGYQGGQGDYVGHSDPAMTHAMIQRSLAEHHPWLFPKPMPFIIASPGSAPSIMVPDGAPGFQATDGALGVQTPDGAPDFQAPDNVPRFQAPDGAVSNVRHVESDRDMAYTEDTDSGSTDAVLPSDADSSVRVIRRPLRPAQLELVHPVFPSESNRQHRHKWDIEENVVTEDRRQNNTYADTDAQPRQPHKRLYVRNNKYSSSSGKGQNGNRVKHHRYGLTEAERQRRQNRYERRQRLARQEQRDRQQRKEWQQDLERQERQEIQERREDEEHERLNRLEHERQDEQDRQVRYDRLDDQAHTTEESQKRNGDEGRDTRDYSERISAVGDSGRELRTPALFGSGPYLHISAAPFAESHSQNVHSKPSSFQRPRYANSYSKVKHVIQKPIMIHPSSVSVDRISEPERTHSQHIPGRVKTPYAPHRVDSIRTEYNYAPPKATVTIPAGSFDSKASSWPLDDKNQEYHDDPGTTIIITPGETFDSSDKKDPGKFYFIPFHNMNKQVESRPDERKSESVDSTANDYMSQSVDTSDRQNRGSKVPQSPSGSTYQKAWEVNPGSTVTYVPYSPHERVIYHRHRTMSHSQSHQYPRHKEGRYTESHDSEPQDDADDAAYTNDNANTGTSQSKNGNQQGDKLVLPSVKQVDNKNKTGQLGLMYAYPYLPYYQMMYSALHKIYNGQAKPLRPIGATAAPMVTETPLYESRDTYKPLSSTKRKHSRHIRGRY